MASQEEAVCLGSFASRLSSALDQSDDGAVNQPLHSSAEKLASFFEPTSTETGENGSYCCSVPSLQARASGDSRVQPNNKKKLVSSRPSSKPLLEDAVAVCMKQTLQYKQKDLVNLPITLLQNLTRSFMSLVDSRLRSSVQALAQHQKLQHQLLLMSQSNNQQQHQEVRDMTTMTKILAGILFYSPSPSTSGSKTSKQNVAGGGASCHAIEPTTVVTTFRTLAFSEKSGQGDYVAPLIMEAVMDLKILGGEMVIPITIEAPGTIQASFVAPRHTNTSPLSQSQKEPASSLLIKEVEVVIDTTALLQSMMRQARSAVSQVLRCATKQAASKMVTAMAAENTENHELVQSVLATQQLPTHPGQSPLLRALSFLSSSASSSSSVDLLSSQQNCDGSGGFAGCVNHGNDNLERQCSFSSSSPSPPRIIPSPTTQAAKSGTSGSASKSSSCGSSGGLALLASALKNINQQEVKPNDINSASNEASSPPSPTRDRSSSGLELLMAALKQQQDKNNGTEKRARSICGSTAEATEAGVDDSAKDTGNDVTDGGPRTIQQQQQHHPFKKQKTSSYPLFKQ